jgi:hypothetical protein
MINFPHNIKNIPPQAGALAARKQFFGDASRYAVAPIHTRFDAVSWFVWDALKTDDDGHSTVIRQEETLAAAVAGLE